MRHDVPMADDIPCQLSSGLLRHMRSVDASCPNYFDKDNHGFKELHAAIDNLGRALRKDGIGAEIKHASVITLEEEEVTNGNIGSSSPKALRSVVFFTLR